MLASTGRLVDARQVRGEVRHERGNFAGAALDVSAAHLLWPGSAEVESLRGRMLLEAGEIESALPPIERAMTMHPGDVAAGADCAIAWAWLGDAGRANGIVDRLVGANPRSPGAWLVAARVCLWTEDRPRAERLLQDLSTARFQRSDRVAAVLRGTLDPGLHRRQCARRAASIPVRVPVPVRSAECRYRHGRTADRQRVYIGINRRKFLPRQKDFPSAREAPLLDELEQGAERLGVERDGRGRRRLTIDAALLDALFSTIGRTPDGEKLMREWGARWGQLAIVDLETEVLQAEAKTLAELSMTRAMTLLADYLHRQRLARVTFDFRHTAPGAIVLHADRSAFADATSSRACVVVEGLFARLLSHLAKRHLVVREARCAARGASACEFVAMAAVREAALVEATSALTTPADRVVRAVVEGA